jgi:hypothetical protein
MKKIKKKNPKRDLQHDVAYLEGIVGNLRNRIVALEEQIYLLCDKITRMSLTQECVGKRVNEHGE